MMGSLKQFIHFAEHSSEVWCAKDTGSHYMYANWPSLEILRLPRKFEYEGLLDGELPATIAEFEKELQAHDRLVEATKEVKRSLEIHPWGKDQVWSAYYCDKFPLFNENNEVVGTILHAYPALDLRFGGDKMDAGSFIFGTPDDTLSKKEWDFVYFVTRGYSTKEIARLSATSSSTIASRQDSVFNKLGIDTLTQLKQMAVTKGWNNYIPTDLLRSRHIELW